MSEMTVESFVGIDIAKRTLDVRIEPNGEALHVAYAAAGVAAVCPRGGKPDRR